MTEITPQARSMANATATSIVLGLVIAQLRDLHPGAVEDIEARLETVVAHMASVTDLDPTIVDEVVRHARGLLATRNI